MFEFPYCQCWWLYIKVYMHSSWTIQKTYIVLVGPDCLSQYRIASLILAFPAQPTFNFKIAANSLHHLNLNSPHYPQSLASWQSINTDKNSRISLPNPNKHPLHIVFPPSLFLTWTFITVMVPISKIIKIEIMCESRDIIFVSQCVIVCEVELVDIDCGQWGYGMYWGGSGNRGMEWVS